MVILVGFYSDEIIREIQSTADIVEVISNYTSLKKRGDDYIGLCPFHSEKTPSFNVSPSKQLFYCFGCGTGGNVFTFLMNKEGLTFPETLKWLAARYNINIVDEIDGEMTKAFRQKQKLLSINRQVAKYYNDNLFYTKEGQRALGYLSKRGITKDTMKTFFLGYAPPTWDGLINFAKKQRISLKDLETLGLVIRRKDNKGYYDRFRDRIIFPIEDNIKNIIGFGGRTLGEGQPKYLNSPESQIFSKGDNLYALSLIKKDPDLEIIVVEGYMDCISLHQRGFKQVVASLGTALTKNQSNMLKRFTKKVILAYDSDSAGKKATLRGIKILEEAGLGVRVLNLPEGEDPDEFILKHGVKAFNQLLLKAPDVTSFLLNSIAKELDLTSPRGKLEFTQRSVKILARMDDKIKQDFYIKKITQKTGISEAAMRTEIKKSNIPKNGSRYKINQITNNNKESGKIFPLTGFYKAELNLLKLFIDKPELREKISEEITVENFTHITTKNIANVIFKIYQREKEITASEIFNYLDEKTSKVLSKIIVKKVDSSVEDAVDSYINKVKEGYYKKAINTVRNQIKQAEIVGQREEILGLLKTYQKLKNEMEHLKIHQNMGKGGA